MPSPSKESELPKESPLRKRKIRRVLSGTRTPRPYSARTGKPAELHKLVPSQVLPASDVAQRRKDGVCRRRAPLITGRGEKCKDCGGTNICEHNRRRSICKNCGSASTCKHNRQRESAGTAGARRDKVGGV